MSGDHGLRSSLPACLRLLESYPQTNLTLVGDRNAVEAALGDAVLARVSLVDVAQALSMDVELGAALRQRDGENSLQAALAELVEGRAQALVSAGPTGAMMALARRELGMQVGIHRPALCAPVPGPRGFSLMLDLGANVDCTAEQLLEFARLGCAHFSQLQPGSEPRVALLSNGTEEGKGNAQVRAATEMFAAMSAFNYIGQIEADALLFNTADVIVCDGFAGNIALKAMEGTARYITERGHSEALAELSAWGDPEQHNGALMLGLEGLVVKSHGGAGPDGFFAALEMAQRSLTDSA